MEAAAYDERLHVPLRWWVQATMLLATLWLALVVALPAAVAWGISGFLLGCEILALVAFGSIRITVSEGVLRAGRARIEARYLGAVEALDPEATRRVAGRDADVRAFLLLRPFLKRAVRVQVVDPADPAPYWLLSTRHPEELARALTSLVGPAASPRA